MALLKAAYKVVFTPVIWLLFGVAVVVFIWGLIELISSADSSDGRDKGKRHILWGLVGIAIMLSAFGIVAIVANTLDVDNPAQEFSLPPYQDQN